MSTMIAPANTFAQECERAGIGIEAYRGRFYWTGPAARASTIDALVEVARATTVPLQWDSPLVYPVDSDSTWYEWAQENPGALPEPTCTYCGGDGHTEDDCEEAYS